ncbi:hypothetical protein Tco_0928283 [Tanacetum coccineum]
MREEQNQPEVMQELLLKLMDDLQILKGSQQENKETAAQNFIPYWNSSMIDDEVAKDNFFFGEIKDTLMDKQYRQKDIQELMRKLLEDVRNISEEFSEYINCPSWNRPLFYFDNADDEYTVIWRRPKAITPDLPTEEPEDSLIMGDEHLDTIPKKELDEVIKSNVEDLVPIPSESEDFFDNESECDVPVNDETFLTFTTFPNPLFDSNDDFTSSDDESLFDEDEFSGELAHIDPIPPGIEKVNFDLEEEIRLVENLLYDNSSPRPPKELNLEIADTILKSLSPSHIPVTDSDSLMEEIDLFLASNDSMPPGIQDDDYDSEGDIRFLEELLNNDSLLLPEFESFHFVPSFPRPPPEPPDVEISLVIEPNAPVINNVDELNEDECFDPGGGENNVKVDNSFIIVTRTFLPFLTYLEVSPLLSSARNKDTIFDPGIST